jgi:hypothetical protein
MDKEMNKKEIAKKVIELCENEKDKIKGVSPAQLQNLRSLVKRTQDVNEIIIYLEYQGARESKMRDFSQIIKNEIKKFENSPENLKYFIGNLVRYATSIIKSKEG